MWTQAEAGHGCPLSMTHAAVPALRTDPELAAEWEPLLTSRVYEQELRPPAEKTGALAGMAMTEKQGGSDVRANTTRAEPLAAPGEYALTGHKWFCSAPMSDAFLVLAQAPGGLTCFLLPRVLPDGTRNSFRIQRLKDKLGNRSNASAEIEFDGRSWARRVGEEGRGVATIIEMVAATRLDCVTGAAAVMRQAVAQAVHHTAHREAFGGPLIDKPLMRNVLADLALESEAATTLALRLAAAYDGGQRAGPELSAARGAGRQVLGDQAVRAAGRRGAGVPGRQRLRRGVGDAAAAARGAAELDLGGLGQRPGARRPAGAAAGARRAERLPDGDRHGPGRGPPAGSRRSRGC